MSQIWLTSDTHLGHDFVARTRGFEDHADHDDHLARRWDKRVRDDDHIWVLGDVAMNGWAERLRWFADRPGRRHLVLGNHDRAHPMNRNAHDHLWRYLAVFDTVQTAAQLSYKGQRVLLSHFPYDGEGFTRGDDQCERATQWRLRDARQPLLHGHCHDAFRYRRSYYGTPMYHVGLDAWDLAPVTIHDAMKEAK